MSVSNPVWYAGVCDELLYRFQVWRKNWVNGEVAATRPALIRDKIEDIPTKMACRVAFKKVHFEHLVRILEAVKPDWALTVWAKEVLAGIDRGKLLPFSYREITLVTYYEDVDEICKILEEAKDGKKDDLAVSAGGGLWKIV